MAGVMINLQFFVFRHNTKNVNPIGLHMLQLPGQYKSILFLTLLSFLFLDPLMADTAKKKSKKKEKLTNVKVLEISKKRLEVTNAYTGYLKPLEKMVVSSETEGVTEQIAFRKGDTVKTDQVLVNIATERLSLRKKAASSAYASAVSAYKTEKIMQDKNLTNRELNIQLKLAQSNLKLAEANLENEKKLQEFGWKDAQVQLKAAQSDYNLSLSNYKKEKKLLQRKISTKAKVDEKKNELDRVSVALERAKLALEQARPENNILTQTRIETEQNRVDNAEAAVENARLALERSETTTKSKLDSLRYRLDEAKVQMKLARLDLKRSKVKSPFSGVVSEKFIEKGKFIRPGESLLEIMDISSVLAKIYVPVQKIKYLKRGDQVTVRLDAIPKRVFQGRVRTLGLEADPKSRSFPIEVLINNPDRELLPGMMARIQIEQESSNNQIVIPRHVVMQRSEGSIVFVIDNNIAKLTKVSLGKTVKGNVQILSGLSTGDKLVISGQQYLTDNERVNILHVSK